MFLRILCVAGVLAAAAVAADTANSDVFTKRSYISPGGPPLNIPDVLSKAGQPIDLPKIVIAGDVNLCSIPLLEMNVPHPEKMDKMAVQIPAGSGKIDAIAKAPPVPVCKDWK